MASILETIKRLLPNGTEPKSGTKKWERVPGWPPDVFAIAAFLVNLSGCYTEDKYSGRADGRNFFGPRYRTKVKKVGEEWRRDVSPPRFVQELWEILTSARGTELTSKTKWQDAAIWLLAISDEAADAMGMDYGSSESPYSDFVLSAHEEHLNPKGRRKLLPYFPFSLCVLVPPSEACVQPKTLTSQVGCTLRSLSHHLALLPPSTEVTTRWQIGESASSRRGPMNLLLVPFPYNIPGDSFSAGSQINDENGKSAHFEMVQKWLPTSERTKKILSLLDDLIKAAETEVGDVHGVVLPEIALDQKTAREIATLFSRRKNSKLELFVTGISAPPKKRGQAKRNSAYASFISSEVDWQQSKHHRWRVDRHQVERYNIGHALDPDWLWWEEIDISTREINFFVFRPGASLSVLVCEDLARIDPVQPILRAIGPNLVIALLQDGPQLAKRWPARYATVLSDDPGSSVLTLTSLGMVERSKAPGEVSSRLVALWGDSINGTRELILPKGSHGLVLNLCASKETNWTLDGRSDDASSVRLSLGGVHAVSLRRQHQWLTES